jgi:hypothetical protein
MNKPAERDVLATCYAIKGIKARFSDDTRKLESAARRHARVESFCAVASVLIVQAVTVFFFYQLLK